MSENVKSDMYQSLSRDRLSEEVARQLTELIVSGRIPPGEYLDPEEELAEQLGVSRSVVREAIRTLESRFLVRRKRGVGTVVTDGYGEYLADAMDLSIRGNKIPVEHFLDFRSIIETGVVRLAVAHATDSDIEALRDALQRMQGDGHGSASVQADVDFHVQLAASTHNEMLQIVLRAIRDVLRDSIERTRKVQDRPKSGHNFHARILQGIESRNEDLAVEAMTEHLADTQRLLRRSGARWVSRAGTDSTGDGTR